MASQHDRIGPPEAFGQPPRTGRFWFDLLAATAAIFISVISLVVAFRGEATQRGLLAANSWPFLQLSKDQLGDDDTLDVENAGVGPAKIYTYKVFYKGAQVQSVMDLLRKCCGLPPPPPQPGPNAAQATHATHASLPGWGYGSVFGNVLRPGEHIISMRVRESAADPNLFNRFSAAMPYLSFQACYCSILKECWIADMESLAQNQVASCPPDSHPFAMGDGG